MKNPEASHYQISFIYFVVRHLMDHEGVRFPTKSQFPLLQNAQTGYVTHPPSCPGGVGCSAVVGAAIRT